MWARANHKDCRITSYNVCYTKLLRFIVELENITKEFPGVKALDHVQFNLKRGEVLAFLGENGAGKSTLMKILSGIYSKDEGTIKIVV